MGRIGKRFLELKKKGHKAFIGYLMGGDPDLKTTEEIIPYLSELGVDLIEIGVPFSDPLADGPTIQEAGQRALKTTLPELIDMVARLRSNNLNVPLLFMSYYNPILKYSEKKFIRDIAKAGIDGLIIPDLIPEEGKNLIDLAKSHQIDFVPLLAPTSTDRRIHLLSEVAGGFLYYVSRTGTTGAKEDIAGDLKENLQRIHSQSNLPVVVGFGISNSNQAVEVTRHADGVVVGSAIVKRIAEANGDPGKIKQALKEFLSPILSRLHSREP